jgi:hypothetical protein
MELQWYDSTGKGQVRSSRWKRDERQRMWAANWACPRHTIYAWKAKCVSEAQRLRQLEDEEPATDEAGGRSQPGQGEPRRGPRPPLSRWQKCGGPIAIDKPEGEYLKCGFRAESIRDVGDYVERFRAAGLSRPAGRSNSAFTIGRSRARSSGVILESSCRRVSPQENLTYHLGIYP